MKKILLVLLMALTLIGCSTKTVDNSINDSEPVRDLNEYLPAEINVGMLKGPTGMGMVKLMDDASNGLLRNTYNFTLDTDATILNQMLIKGELDIASIPTNAVSVLNNKTEGKVVFLAINTTGNLYILSKDDSIKSLSDLEGKSVVSAGAAANPEYIMNMLLRENGLTDKVNYVANEGTDHGAALAEYMAGKYDAIMLPEPFVTQALTKDADTKKVVNLTEAFEKTFNSPMVLGAVAVRKDFVEANPDAVVLFLQDLENSINFVNENVEEAAALCEKYDVIKEAVALKAIPSAGITFMKSDEMAYAASNFLSLLYQEAPASIGGTEPSDALFYLVD